MKITFFVGEFNGGGAERVISILANKLVEKDFDVEILKYHNTENAYKTDKRINITSVEENTNTRSNLFKNVLWMHKYFKNTNTIISFLAPFNIIAIIANLGNKTPIIVSDRNNPNKVPNNKVVRTIRNFLYRKTDKVVVQTNESKGYFSYLKDKCIVIPNPIDMKEYAGIALKIKKENKIVSVGRLEKQKNQLLLIDAFNDIKDKYKDFNLYIYGEGSHRIELENRIAQLNLKDRVFLPGNSNKVFEDIKDAKLFVLTSNYEGMPNALAEAMCLGIPSISTNVSGVKDLIEDGQNGYIINVNDKDALINRMQIILNDVKLSEDFSTKSVQLNDKLNVDTISNTWCELIKQINM